MPDAVRPASLRRLAILDDYQGAALASADFAPLTERGLEITVFTERIEPAQLASRLEPFDAIVAMRERTAFPAQMLRALPRLRLLVNTGRNAPNVDLEVARQLGIEVCGTGGSAHGAPELTWALMLAALRHLPTELANGAQGRWQSTVGREAAGLTLGLVGLGNIGQKMARYAEAFGMRVLAWSPHLTPERAERGGAEYVASLTELAQRSDVLSVHLKLAESTRGLVNAEVLSALGPHGLLVNTARGPLVDEAALLTALRSGQLGGAALDVFDVEPLPAEHPLRTAPNTLLTPHIGFVTQQSLAAFYAGAVQDVLAYLDGAPVNVLN